MDISQKRLVGADPEIVMDYQDVQFVSSMSFDEDIVKFLAEEKVENAVRSKMKFCTPYENALSLPFYILTAGFYTVGERHITKRSGVENYQILLTTKGNAVIEMDGQEYLCEKGSVIVVDCRQEHSYRTGDKGAWEYKHVHFSSSACRELIDKCVGYYETAGDIEHYLDEIFEELERYTPISCYKFSDYMSRILTHLVLLKMGQNHLDEHRELVESAAAYLRAHYQEKIQMNDLAQRNYVSVCYFIRLFKEYYGVSPYSYLMQHRVNMAKEKLINGMTVDDIAQTCGFGHTNNFFRVFKQQTGQTPNKFRSQYFNH